MTTPNPKIFRRVAAAALSFSGLSAAFAEPIFTPYTAIPTGSWPEATAIGDVNGDGLKDVVMTTSSYFDPENDYKLFVFLQAANGQLQAPIKYATQGIYTSRPQSVDIGDVNGDGKNDVAVGNDRASIQIFLQDPNGNLASSAIYATQNSTVIKIGDLNGDGRLDIAGIGHGTSNASVLYQNPGGTLAPPLSFNAPHGGFDDLDIGDINADNRNDLIVMSGQGYAYDNLAILTQTLNGSFNPVVFYDLGDNVNTQGLGVGDVNGDQFNDVIVSYGGNKPASKIGIFHQQSGVLRPAVSLPSYDIPEPVEVKDVTGDGLSDVVVLHGGWNKMGVYVQTADGSLGAEQLFPIPYASSYNVQGLALGDINNDGLIDAAIADYNHGLVVLYQEEAGTNHPPVANAGQDQYLELGSSPLQVVLDSGGSRDPDNDPLSFHWTLTGPAGSSAVLDDSDIANPTFTADVAGAYTAQLQVFDGKVYSETDTVIINVTTANLPPIANAGPDQNLQLSQNPLQIQLDGSGSSDPENEPLSYYWTLTAPAGSNAVLDDYMLANPSFTADVAGTYTIYLMVYDGYRYSQTDTVTITVTSAPNLLPIADAGIDQRVLQGTKVSLDGSKSRDGEPKRALASWSWTQIGGPAVVLNNTSTSNPSFTAPKLKGLTNTTLTFELTVTDNDGATDSARAQIIVVKQL
ncbi:MAG: PKD domain-containing protein [Methylomicrobium sp.]